MRYEIYENGTLINTIVADESFVNTYCADNGYTYQEAPLPEPPEPEPDAQASMAASEYVTRAEFQQFVGSLKASIHEQLAQRTEKEEHHDLY